MRLRIQRIVLVLFFVLSTITAGYTQPLLLPDISVNAYNGKVITKWMHTEKNITAILIQRSYDSTRHFSTIGTVLNPLNTENGYLDPSPPYEWMYYRVMIMYEGGQYIIGPSRRSPRPVKQLPELLVTNYPIQQPHPLQPSIPTRDSVETVDSSDRMLTIDITPVADPPIPGEDTVFTGTPKSETTALLLTPTPTSQPLPSVKNSLPTSLPQTSIQIQTPKLIVTSYPSQRIFVSKNSQISLSFPQQDLTQYRIVFYRENNEKLFEINQLTDPYITLQKANFQQAGWYYFDIFRGNDLIEKNRMYIAKEKFKSMLN
jgi:hypothetical protein